MINIDEIDSHYDRCISAAEHWEREKLFHRARAVYSDCISDALTVCTMRYSVIEDVLTYLKSRQIAKLLELTIDLTELLLPQVLADRQKIAYIGSSTEHAFLIGLCWMFGYDQQARRILNLVNTEIYQSLYELYWGYFVGQMNCFEKGTDCNIDSQAKATGLMVHLKHYIELMETYRNGGDIQSCITMLELNFQKRQNSKRFQYETPVTMGTHDNPVKWDFWKTSIMAYAQRHY